MLTFDEQSIIYGLDYQARALASLQDPDRVAFLVGTQSLKFDNQISMLDFDEESNQIVKQSFIHSAGEIWHLAPHPCKSDIFTTCYNFVVDGKCKPGCSLWSLRADDEDTKASVPTLQNLQRFDCAGATHIAGFYWQPLDVSRAFLLVDGRVILFDAVGAELIKLTETKLEGKGGTVKFTVGKWNPHHKCQTLITASESAVKGWDIRAFDRPVWSIDNAHIPVVRDLDFNPNVQYHLATVGDDCRLKIWDIRQQTKPVHTIANQHSHWIWCVRYNPVHDQLLLTSSSDSRLLLHCMVSLSSESLSSSVLSNGAHDISINDDSLINAVENVSSTPKLEDGLLKRYDDHEESVYCADWAVADPWVFASLSFDGRLIINKVPRSVKYSILQL